MACPASPIHYQYNPIKTVKTCTIGVINILGLAKNTDNATAYISGQTLYTEGAVGGIQFKSNLISTINSHDIINSNNDKTIIYNLNNNLYTNKFEFESFPEDLIVVSSNGDLVDVQIKSPFLVSAFPNPFNPITTIEFSIPIDGDVSINIYDLAGKEVSSLSNQYYSSGSHQIIWDAENYSSGIYFIKIMSGNHINTQVVTLIK